MKNGFMFEHIWEPQGASDGMQEGVFVSIDYSKAFGSVHHNYFNGLSLYIGLPVPRIALILSMLTLPFIFGWERGWFQRYTYTPS